MLGLFGFNDFCFGHCCRKLLDRVGFDRHHKYSYYICDQLPDDPIIAFFEPKDSTGLSSLFS